MKLLLDTHVFLWWDTDRDRLPPRVLALCCDPSNALMLSLASVWEMQIKVQKKKLKLRIPLPELLRDQEQTNRLQILPIDRSDIFKLSDFPDHHRDPFDRLIAAQALRGGFNVVSHDPMMARYGVQVIW